jgi:hypothetical protein
MHAKTEWKVDIICILSGFNLYPSNPSYRDELYDAVSAASEGAKTLIFAAASNLGLRSEVTFPGCLSIHSKLICLSATAGNGDPESPRLNPAAIPNTYDFAFMGERIQIYPEEELIGDTFYSAIIPAAIAAYLMDFANHPDVKGKIEYAKCLREVKGMASILASMTAHRKNGCRILNPWKLMGDDQYVSSERTEKRQEIRRNISDALRERGYAYVSKVIIIMPSLE